MLRRGMTLVEVLVVLGIMAVIVAITIPAIQSARESARRLQCQNNLRQMLIANESHHAANDALPSLYNGTSLTYPLAEWDLFHMHSWRVALLPYLEQSLLKDRLNWNALATDDENLPVAQTVVSTFICPSGGDPRDMGWGLKYKSLGIPPDSVTENDRYRVVRSDYDAMSGIQVLPNSPLELVEHGQYKSLDRRGHFRFDFRRYSGFWHVRIKPKNQPECLEQFPKQQSGL